MSAEERCAHCGVVLQPCPDLPGVAIHTDGTPMQWCSEACTEAWMAADPKRREGWIALADLTPERVIELFQSVGLELVGTPSGPVMPS